MFTKFSLPSCATRSAWPLPLVFNNSVESKYTLYEGLPTVVPVIVSAPPDTGDGKLMFTTLNEPLFALGSNVIESANAPTGSIRTRATNANTRRLFFIANLHRV